MMPHTFILRANGLEVPIEVTAQALADFREHGLAAMDECLARRALPRDDVDPIDVVGDMMLEGLHEDNTRKLTLCALWMAHYHPGVTGLAHTPNGTKPLRDSPPGAP